VKGRTVQQVLAEIAARDGEKADPLIVLLLARFEARAAKKAAAEADEE
jgi:hypothetical protein